MTYITTAQVTLIKNSWKKLQKIDPLVIGDIFYSKLFLEAPPVQHLFTSPRKEQSNKLIATLAVVVSKLEQPGVITHAVQQLALRHVNYGVKPQHYELVGAVLLFTLQQGLGDDWNKDLAEAWSACYNMLANTMMNAAYKEPAGATP
jgi:hemoglobin-like flavoprotein